MFGALTKFIWGDTKTDEPRKGWRGLLWTPQGFVAGVENDNRDGHKGERCKTCNGAGWDADWGGPYKCDQCGGSGVATVIFEEDDE